MPTPNWGPQAGIPMDDATFDAYVAANPPGQSTNNIYRETLGTQVTDAAAGAIAPLMNQERARYWSQIARGGPPTTFASQYQTGNQDQARLEQQRVIQALQAQAAGDPNSLAQQQLQNAYGQAQSQQSSLGSTMRGQSAGAAQRGIQQGQQQIQRALPGDQQMLMLQEQQAAQAMLAQLLAQQQGQDITQAQGMAQGQLDAQQLNDAMKQFYMSQGILGDTGTLQTGQDLNRAQYGFDLEADKILEDNVKNALNAGGTAVTTAAQYGWGGGNK